MLKNILLEQTLNGVLLGSIYALIAIGYTLVWNILAFINFAHGEVYMIGTFVALTALTALKWPLWVAAPAGILCGALLGVVMERVVYRQIRGLPKLNLLIAAIGVSILLQNLAQLIWGASPRRFPSALLDVGFPLGTLRVNYHQVAILGVSVALMLALRLFMANSLWGKAVRATAQDMEAASLLGINVNRVIGVTFALGSAVAVVAGLLVGPLYTVYPTMGGTAGLKGFTASVLGGMGSIPGAMVGGLLLGILESLAVTFVSSGYRDGVAMAILILILLVRPSGLFGQKQGVRP